MAAAVAAACSSSSGAGPGDGDGDAGARDGTIDSQGAPTGTGTDTDADGAEPADATSGASDAADATDASTVCHAGYIVRGGTCVLSPPAVAADAGFTHLVFDDDFTTSDTIATTQYADTDAGFKWYWALNGKAQPWKVDTAATATGTKNGNDGGGAGASALGGILTLTGPGNPNDALMTVPGWVYNADRDAGVPPEGQGAWQHGYFEAYLQFKIDGSPSNDYSNGWPAFWSWSVQATKNYGFYGSSLTVPNFTEVDFMESFGSFFGQKPGNWHSTMHQWPDGGPSAGNTQMTDDDWHAYGCLWVSTGKGTGTVRFYRDGVQYDATIPTGPGQTQFTLETMDQFILLGTGNGWPMNVDWVHVWQ